MPARSPQTYTAPSPLPSISGSITLKAVTDLPARLYGGNAQEVEVSGLDYTLHLDIEKLPIADTATAANKWTAVWDAANDTYGRVEFSSLPLIGLEGKVDKAGDTMTGALTAPQFNLTSGGGLVNLSGANGYTVLVDGSGGNSITVGGTATNNSFYDNTTHLIRSRGGSTSYASFDATKVAIPLTTASTSPTTGALTVAGGVGVAGYLMAASAAFKGSGGGNVFVDNTDDTAAVQSAIIFRRGVALATVGSITTTNVATALVTSSDARLKEDLQPIDSGAMIDALQAHTFRWKVNGERDYGVIAQDAAEVVPQACFHDEQSDQWGTDYSKFVPILLAELKALRARVAALEGD